MENSSKHYTSPLIFSSVNIFFSDELLYGSPVRHFPNSKPFHCYSKILIVLEMKTKQIWQCQLKPALVCTSSEAFYHGTWKVNDHNDKHSDNKKRKIVSCMWLSLSQEALFNIFFFYTLF